jgi:3-oxoacyl-[acyl-carrier protein] reductase
MSLTANPPLIPTITRGAIVVTNYPSASLKGEAEATLLKIRATGGKYAEKCFGVESDLATLEGPKHLVEQAVIGTGGGKIDILVNNAGRASPQFLKDVTVEQWDFQVHLNGRGTLLTTQAVLPHLAQGSRIVNLSSGGARQPYPGTSVYNGTKSMIESFTRCWAV